VFRRAGDEPPEVVLVHRPKYDDWTIPKGKNAPGETDEHAALREVEEETGLRCDLLYELPRSRYRDARGKRKLVRYWAMRPVAGEFAPHDEIDEARWLPLAEAVPALSYERDRAVLRAFAAREGA
jgi:8-oxo-dGTP pyrophosphatase MutT (NUDIX family)